MTEQVKAPAYSAKDAYQDYSVAADYERARFTSLLGRYRWRREQNAVRAMVGQLPSGITVLDCPCGTGRWWDLLRTKASTIVAADISTGMLEYAAQRATRQGLDIEFIHGSAEALPLPDGSVDVVFSHALTKHLPRPVQYRVLAEFSRIARRGVLCSFGIMSHVTYEFWKRRRIAESYPMLREELDWMAESAGLRVAGMKQCTTPLGVEHSVWFTKTTAVSSR